jgi:pyrimidine-specific ribonucleoside hydrolase
MKRNIIFEMETSDPDDFMTLLWLADHPDVNLLGVVVTPGGYDQCQLVHWGLRQCGRDDVPVGALHGVHWWQKEEANKRRVSGFHYKVYGEEIHEPAFKRGSKVLSWVEMNTVLGPEMIRGFVARGLDFTYLVGSPPKNFGEAGRRGLPINEGEYHKPRWVQQGGFAGDSLVAPEDRLEKFAGKETVPSFNPGGAWKQTLELLDHPAIGEKRFVSKNVCHGVIWDSKLQARLKARLRAPFIGPTKYVPLPGGGEAALPSYPPADWMSGLRAGLRIMMHGLDTYLRDKGKAKAMHDLVAAACALDPDVCRWSPEVEIYRVKGEWGARPKAGTETKITVGFNLDRFVEILAR